jgi:YggT family protein
MISSLLWLFNAVMILYMLVIIAMVVMTWLTAFKAADPQTLVVARIDRALFALTNPVMNPVRRVIPSIGGVDLSPVIVLLLLEFFRRLINSLLAIGAAPAS